MDKTKNHKALFTCQGQNQVENDTKKHNLNKISKFVDVDLDIFDDEDDDILAQACDNSEKMNVTNIGGAEHTSMGHGSEAAKVLPYASVPQSTPLESLPGFDAEAGQTWVYPINYPIREYQFSVVEEALFKNTLISLPTGLGKTFIAAVVMYNFYRWYPRSKIVFMAPTKPLVTQQIEACYNIMGIPQSDTSQMTGSVAPENRIKAWTEKRVFFLTPQVLTNDLARGAAPATLIKCLVLDEAHRALGNHAYCQVVRGLRQHHHDFRILALSATPGSDLQAVQQVLTNLMISHIELRNEDSPDIQSYVHQRSINKVVVPLGELLTSLKTRFLTVARVYVNRLLDMKVLYTKDETTLTKFQILQAREAFRQCPPGNLSRQKYGIVEGLFALCMTLYHSYELLMQHGARSFYKFLKGTLNGDKGYSYARSELLRNQVFQQLMDELAEKFEPKISLSQPSKHSSPGTKIGSPHPSKANNVHFYEISHPKMAKLLSIVIDHHKKCADEEKSTRIMIFSQYRESVIEITEMLQCYHPLVKAMSFLGQSSKVRGERNISQKEQLKVVSDFRSGEFNTLVSTCVGEEGLDIGEVDLIICYDAPKSPIRLVQRMGRTGRKREGHIVVLVTRGKEEQMYNQSQFQKKKINEALTDKNKLIRYLSPDNARMVPRGMTPVCMKLHMQMKAWKTQTGKGRKSSVGSGNSISAMLHNSSSSSNIKGKDHVNGSYLSQEELAWWKENLQVPLSDVKTIPRPSLMYLKKQELEEDSNSMSHIDLGTYQPWQTMAQTTHVIGHSPRTHHFVKLVEFINLQQLFDGDDDPYGLEMASFLDMAYIEDDSVKKPSLFSSVEKDLCIGTQHTLSQEKDDKDRKKRGRKKCLSSKENNAKKSIHSSLIATMFSQKSQSNIEKQKLIDCQDLDNFDIGNEVIIVEECEGETHEDKMTDVDNPVCNVRESTSKENFDLSGDVFEFVVFQPLKQQSPLHIHTPPVKEDFSKDDHDSEPASPSDILTEYKVWMEKRKGDIIKNLHKSSKRTLDSYTPNKSIKPLTKGNSKNFEFMTLIETNDSSDELPDLLGGQEKNTNKKNSTAEIIIEATSPVFGNKGTLIESIGKNNKTVIENEKSKGQNIPSPDIFDRTTASAKINISPVYNCTYRKPVRTNLTVCSSTPKDTAKCLFKVATPELTAIEHCSPLSRETEISYTPTKLLTAAHARRQQVIQKDSENSEPAASSSSTGVSYRSKVRTKLSKYIVSESSMSRDDMEASSPQKIASINVSTIKLKSKDSGTENCSVSNEITKSIAIESKKRFNDDPCLSLDDDLFIDIEENKSSKVELHAPSEPTEKNVKSHRSKYPSLLSVTQIIDLVNESSVVELENTEDETELKLPPHTLHDIVESKGMSSKSFISKLDINNKNSYCNNKDNPTEKKLENKTVRDLRKVDTLKDLTSHTNNTRAMLSQTMKEVNTSKELDFSLLDNIFSHEEDKPKGVEKQKSTAEDSIHFDLLGIDEFDLMSESLLGDIELNLQMEDLQGQQICRRMGKNVNSKEGLDKRSIDISSTGKTDNSLGTIPRHQKDLNLTNDKSTIRLSSIGTVFSPTQEDTQAWQRRKRYNVVESDSEVAVSDDSENYVTRRFAVSPIHKNSTMEGNKWISRKKKKKLEVQRNLEDDNDFQEDSIADYHKAEQNIEKPGKFKKKKNNFIEDEAELSKDGQDVSSDESEGHEDEYDNSFVDDCTQMTQDTAIDMKAVYLQSVVSPLKMALPNHHHHRPQLCDSDESYQDNVDGGDSFVVDNNFVEYDTEYMGDDMLAEDPIIAQAHHDVETKKTKESKAENKSKRKRIIINDSSSEDEIVIENKKTKTSTHQSNILGEISAKNKITGVVRPSDVPQIIQCKDYQKSQIPKEISSNKHELSKFSKLLENEKLLDSGSHVLSLSLNDSVSHYKTQLPVADCAAAKVAPLRTESFSNQMSTPHISEKSGSSLRLNNNRLKSAQVQLDFSLDDDPRDLSIQYSDLEKGDKEKQVEVSQAICHNSAQASGTKTVSVASTPASEAVSVKPYNINVGETHHHWPHPANNKPSNSSSLLIKQMAPVVLVDSSEINSGGNIVSKLRLNHGARTAIVQLEHSHYVVSMRMAVIRLLYSVFSSSQEKVKLVQRVQGMLDLYDQPVIIVEMDHVKPGEFSRLTKNRSKYLNTIICACAQVTQLKVLYSSGQEQTAILLSQLLEQEQTKGYNIPVLPERITQMEQMVNFYRSLPHISYTSALCLAQNFRTVADFVNSSAEVVQDKGRISIQRATAIKLYLSRGFRPDMLPPQ
ncbi:Fanconi anemia group M protein-like isoform X2 [Homarus americanus]|nr:Fanconi anemia group M protein-like isoform X2 [Homarus americanus]